MAKTKSKSSISKQKSEKSIPSHISKEQGYTNNRKIKDHKKEGTGPRSQNK